MKRLFFSIIFSVIAALFLINWGVDKLAESNDQNNAANHGETTATNEIILYNKLLNGISEQLSLIPIEQLEQKTQQLAKYYQLKLSIEDTENMVLPSTLALQLKQQGSLLLGSQNNAYFLKKIPQHKTMLLRMQLLPQEDNENANVVLTSLLYLGVCGLIILWLLPLTRRLYLLTNAAAKIGEGELQARLPSSKYSYIQPLENSFNSMADKIETLVADNKLLARSLSHDIRTPLACLRFGIEAAIDAEDIIKKNQYIERMDTEITRMEKMTAAFLQYAAMERKSLNLKKQTINVNQLLQNLIDEVKPLAEQKNIYIHSNILSQIVNANIDSHWYYLAIQNIVSNALQYANSEISISLKANENTMVITIEDDGKGIPKNEINDIFTPFVRLDKKGTRDGEHFGLGLATTTRVMEWHKGEIKAFNSKKNGGLCCQLIQPLIN